MNKSTFADNVLLREGWESEWDRNVVLLRGGVVQGWESASCRLVAIPLVDMKMKFKGLSSFS